MIATIGQQRFKFAKIPAILAKQLLDSLNGSMNALRPHISVFDESSQLWIKLEQPEAIEKHLSDWESLTEAELMCYDYNYGFLKDWKPHLLPAAMAATKYRVAESANVDPAVSALISNGLATYKELRDDYSLEEAFKLLDILTVKKINEHRAAEAAKK